MVDYHCLLHLDDLAHGFYLNLLPDPHSPSLAQCVNAKYSARVIEIGEPILTTTLHYTPHHIYIGLNLFTKLVKHNL